eukprot:SAG22_NODE_769_length_7337_cov_15.897624_6_plen_325_part_00
MPPSRFFPLRPELAARLLQYTVAVDVLPTREAPLTKVGTRVAATCYPLQSGGSFGKPAAVVEGKRAARRLEMAALDAALRAELGTEAAGERRHECDDLFVCGDFNTDSNFESNYLLAESGPGPGAVAGGPGAELWPEVELLPERAMPEVFADAWEEHHQVQQQPPLQEGGASADAAATRSGGCTESRSNLMRAALKPGQGREARFDKVVIMRDRVRLRSVELVGTEQCGEAVAAPHNGGDGGGQTVPLFPSDHFGVLVVTDEGDGSDGGGGGRGGELAGMCLVGRGISAAEAEALGKDHDSIVIVEEVAADGSLAVAANSSSGT